MSTSVPEHSPAKTARRARYRLAALAAAAELFAEHGVDGTRIEAIAARAGMAPRTLYTVFDSKQVLVEAVDDHYRAALLDAARRAVSSADSAWHALLDTVAVVSQYYLAHPTHLRRELRESASWADDRPSRSSGWHEALATYGRLFERAISAGEVRAGEPAAYARALLALHQSQLAHWVATGREVPHASVVADLQLLIRHAFATNP